MFFLPLLLAGFADVEPSPVYMYDVLYRSSEMEVRGQVDPSKPIGDRVTIFHPSREHWSEELRAEIQLVEEDPLEDFWCSNLDELIGNDIELVDRNDGVSRYVFRPIAVDDTAEDRKLVKHLTGEVERRDSDGEILRLTLKSRKSFKLSAMLKIERFETDIQCSNSPDGRTYAAESTVQTIGSYAFYKFNEREEQIISNLIDVSAAQAD